MKTLPKLLALTAVTAASAVGATAAGPGLSAADRIELMRPQLTAGNHILGASRAKAAAAAPAVRSALVQLAPGASAADLEALGATVITLQCGIAICHMPADKVEAVAASDAVARFELSRVRTPQLHKARPSVGLDKAHAGTGLDHPYTGRGVLAGVVDQGIDANHPAFCDADGNTRFKMLMHIKSVSAGDGDYLDVDADYYGTDVSTAKPLDEYTSDTPETFHGSHTLGILGGSAYGKISASATSTVDNPYSGAAPGADLIAACGELSDANIAVGVETLAQYAMYAGKPAVLSLSIGSNIRSHSPKTMMNQVLDYYGEIMPIAISAGNEGDKRLACRKVLTETDRELKTFILPTDDPDIRYGDLYVYSDKPITFKAVVYSKKRRRVISTMTPPEADGYIYIYGTGYGENEVAPEGTPLTTSFEYGSQVIIGYERETMTGEYMGMLNYLTKDNETTNADGTYILGITVSGEPGAYVDVFCDGYYTELDDYDQAGWDDGSYDGTINDMACGLNTIAVGSYNTSDDYPLWVGGEAGFEGRFPAGDITSYSSWSTFHDRASLPAVCAPGAVLVSAYNRDYIDAISAEEKALSVVARAEKDGTTYYYGPSHGTSMATPLVAGSIALWLEANPYLTPAEIKEIIASTAAKDSHVASGDARWGAGKFDAYAGLQEAARRYAAGITDAAVDTDSPLMIRNEGRDFSLFLAGAESIDAEIWSLDGRRVASAAGHGDELTVSLDGATAGIYIVRVNGTHSKRIIIK